MQLKLCIDPGHGGSNRHQGVYDPGAVNQNGLTEADIALQWALTLKWVCASEGVPVYMTRDDDSDQAPLGQRDDEAERAKCSHYLSIHCNAAGSYNGTGVEAFYRDRSDEHLANIAMSAIQAVPGCPKSRGVKSEKATRVGRLSVMDFDGPCALIEIGFTTRPYDTNFMLNRNSRIAFAREFVKLLKEYYANG